MSYPALIIDTKKVESNTRLLVEKCNKFDINVAGVTKVYCAMPEVAKAEVKGGAYMLADSRVENLRKLKDINVPKMLLRIPMLSQIEEVVEYADISLNSEIEIMKALSKKALEKNKVHKVIMMVDLGDLREGVWNSDAVDFAGEILNLKGVELIGIGTNLTCYGAVIPSAENIGLLVSIAEEIEVKYKIKLQIISGGNSSSLYLLDKGEMPKRVNQLRLGEAIVLGNETAYSQRIEDTYDNAFVLAAEIVELKEKQSIPIGQIGVDAFGQKPSYVDRGIRNRAILGIGRQDINLDGIKPIDSDIIILGASSDHLIIDITDCKKSYKLGDIIEFTLTYGALMSAATSEYVYKIIK